MEAGVHQDKTAIRAERRLFVGCSVLLVVAVLLGGQGNGNALREMVIQVFALVVLFLSIPVAPAGSDRVVRAAKAVLAALFALVALHLVPLPYGVWAAVTPVDTATEVLRDLDLEGGWRPYTIDPAEAFDNLLLLLPPAAMFLAVLKLPLVRRAQLAIVLLALAAIAGALALLQYGSGTQALVFYEASHVGVATGFFSNRNHQADLSVIGWLMAAGLVASPLMPTARLSPGMQGVVLLVASTLFVLSVLATGSRAGFLLAGFAALVILVTRIGRSTGKLFGAVIGAGAIGAAAVAISASSGSTLLARTLQRFSNEDEVRLQIWPQVVEHLGNAMPLGVGIGGFVEYYRFSEPLDMVGRKYINSAHNEYLEIALEAGVPGLVLLLAGIAVIAWAGWRSLRSGIGGPGDHRMLQAMAAVSILVILAHSGLDYPLRTTGLAVAFALLCGLLMPKGLGSTPHDRHGDPEKVVVSEGSSDQMTGNTKR